MFYTSLAEMLEILSELGIHICIHDVSGILSNDIFHIDIKNKMHSKAFCDIAKSTSEGFRHCMRCKNRANNKAISGKEPFSGYCVYGLYEAAYPVVINCRVQCIVYVGNAMYEKTERKLKCSANITGVDADRLMNELKNTDKTGNINRCINTARLIGSYIMLTAQVYKLSGNVSSPKNWIIKNIIEYTSFNFNKCLTLKGFSKLYFINEKYLGRLFKKTMGKSFHDYLRDVRLEQALKLLSENKTIIDISNECGFGDVTYFNRVFKGKYEKTPTEYRATDL